MRSTWHAGIGVLIAFTAVAVHPQEAPFVLRDQAQARQAADPRVGPHLERVLIDRAELGLDDHVTFRPLNAATDSRGGVHVRLQAYQDGVRVRNSVLVSHADGRGALQPYTDRVVREITTSPEPKLSLSDALARVEKRPEFTGHAQPPRGELIYFPVYERVLRATGEPLARAGTVPNHALSAPGEINAADVERRLSRVHLAWEIRAVEKGRAAQAFEARVYTVDAHDGRVLQVRAADRYDGHLGTGTSLWQPNTVLLHSIDYLAGFRLYDWARNFVTTDYDRISSDPVNNDINDIWGNGKAFTSDGSASNSMRQTAMVDGAFGTYVYWDLLSNVFGRQGPDGDRYPVNVYTHFGTAWDDAKYSGGNVYLGDGAGRTQLDCLGHEHGHGLNDFTAGLDDLGESDALNESIADIFGELTDIYLDSGAFAQGATSVPARPSHNWVDSCSGRDMIRPSDGGHPNWWYEDLMELDEHDAAGPSNRAFTFLVRGASSYMKDRNYTPFLPWGMNGMTINDGAHLIFDALVDEMGIDTDYHDLRNDMIKVAGERFGTNSLGVRKVMNAYAGINVGVKAPEYPAAPSLTMEVEPNDIIEHAQVIPVPGVGSIPTGAHLPAPRKVRIRGGGNDDDWYRFNVLYGGFLTARVRGDILSNYRVDIFHWYGQAATGEGIPGGYNQAHLPEAVGFEGPGNTVRYFVRVRPVSAWSGSIYNLDVDIEPHP